MICFETSPHVLGVVMVSIDRHRVTVGLAALAIHHETFPPHV